MLSRNIVRRWYDRDGHAPEFIITGTDISAGRECLFTLVRPETYGLLRRAEWMAVQFDSDSGAASEYRGQTEALFTRSERLLQALVASSSRAGRVPNPTDWHLRGRLELCGPPPLRRWWGNE